MVSEGIASSPEDLSKPDAQAILLADETHLEVASDQTGLICSLEVPDVAPNMPEYCSDESSDDSLILPVKILSDCWGSPAARRALGFCAIQKTGIDLTSVRINPLPEKAPGHDIHWLCFGPQDQINLWRQSCEYADRALEAVIRWLEGNFMSLAGAMAASFPLPLVYSAVLGCLEPRQARVIQRRVAGDTLEVIAIDYDVTRERIRQIDTKATAELALHIRSLRAIQHPLALALFGHAQRLAAEVVKAASQENGVLQNDSKQDWIRKVLPEVEAEFLQVFLKLADESNMEAIEQFDPFLKTGFAFQGGRTALQWNDDHVEALTQGFKLAVAGHNRRRADLGAVCLASGLSPEGVSALARFASVTVHGRGVFAGRLKVGDIRREVVFEILSCAGRALHFAEIMEQALSLDLASDYDLRDINRAMTEDDKTFASDGYGMWQIRAELGDVVEDQRLESPALPVSLTHPDLMAALKSLQDRRGLKQPLLGTIPTNDSRFARHAGQRIAAALLSLPEGERRSLAQVLHSDDLKRLTIWLGESSFTSTVEDTPDRQEASGSFPDRTLQSLTILSAFASATISNGTVNNGHWTAIYEACGEEARGWIFNSQRAPNTHILSRLVEVSSTMLLRQTFAFRSDPWSTLIGLQAGLLLHDLKQLPQWLASGIAPIAIRQLLAQGPNYSWSMACTWNALLAFRRGQVGRDAIELLAQSSEWWPAWTIQDACKACTETSHQTERPRDHNTNQLAAVACPVAVGPEGAEQSVVLVAPAAGVELSDPNLFLGALDVALATDAAAFLVTLPKQIRLAPGPIALVGDGFRVGGTIGEDKAVHWHKEGGHVRLNLSGPAERVFHLERGSEKLPSQKVRLWAVEDYLIAFPLGEGRNRSIDPFVSQLPKIGGLALLLHHDLSVSVTPDEVHSLDGNYLLKVFRSGLPNGAKVSCDGEVLWEAVEQSERRRTITDLQLRLNLDGASARWAGRADLVLFDPPAGFVPHKAYVGGQILSAEPDGTRWRFAAYLLLPGMDALRRRGRLDGFFNGERVSIPALVSLSNAPNGSALHDSSGWQPLDPEGCLNASRHREARLWVSLPAFTQDQDWTLFEGPRPVGAYTGFGVRLGSRLFGFGEPLRLELRLFNLNGTGVHLADTVSNTGIAARCERLDGSVRVQLTTAIGWTSRHKAFGWSNSGMVELVALSDTNPAANLLFAKPNDEIDGICIFHGGAWLGSATFEAETKARVSAFLTNAPQWPAALVLAVQGHLPVLDAGVVSAIGTRLRSDSGRGVVALCRTTQDPAHSHILGCILELWEPKPKFVESVLEEFIKSPATGSTQPTVLERLTIDAPCSAIRLIVRGLYAMPSRERPALVERLIRRVLPPNVFAGSPRSPTVTLAAWAEQVLLDRAVEATKFDPNFLASKADASIASLAWASASATAPSRYDANVSTCLTIAPIRRWLSVHLVARAAALLR